MTFAELIDAVMADTHGVQHQGLIERKINAAVRYIIRSGRYPEDLVEETLQSPAIDETTYVQAIDKPARYRSIAYVINSACPSAKFKGYMADELAAKPGASNVFYVGGNIIHLKHKTLTKEFAWGYYTYPADMVADDDTNWLAEIAPDLIVDYASAMVLTQLGEKERTKVITQFSQQNMSILVHDMIDPGGRVV